MAPAYVTKTTQLPVARCPSINYLQSPGCRRTAYVTSANDHARRLQYLALTSAILQT